MALSHSLHIPPCSGRLTGTLPGGRPAGSVRHVLLFEFRQPLPGSGPTLGLTWKAWFCSGNCFAMSLLKDRRSYSPIADSDPYQRLSWENLFSLFLTYEMILTWLWNLGCCAHLLLSVFFLTSSAHRNPLLNWGSLFRVCLHTRLEEVCLRALSTHCLTKEQMWP